MSRCSPDVLTIEQMEYVDSNKMQNSYRIAAYLKVPRSRVYQYMRIRGWAGGGVNKILKASLTKKAASNFNNGKFFCEKKYSRAVVTI